MLIVQPDQDEYVGPVQPGDKARFHGNTVRIFDPRRQSIHTHQLFPDLLGNVRQSRPRRDYANLLRENQAGL